MRPQIADRLLTRCSIEFATVALLVIYPIVTTTIKGATNFCLTALVILAIFEFVRARQFPWQSPDRVSLIFATGMSSLFVATAISQLGHLHFAARPFDGALRFLLAVPVFIYLRRMPIERLTVAQYGFAVSSLFTFLVVTSEIYNYRAGTYFLNPIHFGDISLSLGFLSALSMHWGRIDRWYVVILKLTGFAAGVALSLWSGSRGGWMAIPVAALVWLALADYAWSWRAKLTAFITVVALLGTVYVLVPPVQSRVDLLVSDLKGLSASSDTSTGLRYQIMRAAVVVFTDNPVFGTGSDRFGDVIPSLVSRGFLTETARRLMNDEIHNDVLKWAASAGVFGLIASLAIFLVPFVLFACASRSAMPAQRTAAMMGAVFVASFFVFGQSVEIFILKGTAAFYCITVAVLMAAANNASDRNTVQ